MNLTAASKLMDQFRKCTTRNYPAAYRPLCQRLGLDQGIPFTRHWSAGADFLELIAEHCLEAKPGLIVECSSGLTTLILARCCQINGHGRIYSLENGADFAEATRCALAHYGLEDTASVVHAPLERLMVGGRQFQWYATDELPDEGIDMLVIDGPSGFIQKHSRYPAVPVLAEAFNEGCVAYLDDASRRDERQMVTRWLAEYPGTRHRFVDTKRGCSVLRFSRSGAA